MPMSFQYLPKDLRSTQPVYYKQKESQIKQNFRYMQEPLSKKKKFLHMILISIAFITTKADYIRHI